MDLLFFREVNVFHFIAFADFRRKQLWKAFNSFIEAFSVISGIFEIV